MMHWCKISWISRLLGREKQSSLVSRILKTLVYNPPAKVIFQLNRTLNSEFDEILKIREKIYM